MTKEHSTNKADEDAVGYGKPPKKHQFKPGQSGNPKGRPKKTQNFKTDLKDELGQKVEVLEKGKPVKITKQRLIIKGQINKAAKGDTRAADHVLRWYQAMIGVDPGEGAAMPPAEDDLAMIADFVERKGVEPARDPAAAVEGQDAANSKPARSAGQLSNPEDGDDT